eukprot:6455697-Amphidinium_carterae.1
MGMGSSFSCFGARAGPVEDSRGQSTQNTRDAVASIGLTQHLPKEARQLHISMSKSSPSKATQRTTTAQQVAILSYKDTAKPLRYVCSLFKKGNTPESGNPPPPQNTKKQSTVSTIT